MQTYIAIVSDIGNELHHYGVKNMEWYKRRFQYKDGSLTPLGRIHYGIGKRRKDKAENKILQATINKNRAKKQSDELYEKWEKSDNEYEKLDRKWAKLDDKAEKLNNKAASSSGKDSEKLWEEAGKAQKEADDLWETVSKKIDDSDRLWDSYKSSKERFEALSKEYEDMSKKYIDQYGSAEFDKLPKTDHDIVVNFVDDGLDLVSGKITKKEFNKKYKNTGFRAR